MTKVRLLDNRKVKKKVASLFKVACVIPARYGSERFPGKPLAVLAGKPMIQHVYQRAREARRVDRIIIATDDERILDTVLSFGGEAVLTRKDHPSGMDRVAEVAASLPCEIVVNLQGDEPLMPPAAIDQVVALLDDEPGAALATIIVPLEDSHELFDPNVVKVVMDLCGNALYFSRAPVPFPRDGVTNAELISERPSFFKHLGLYAFRRPFLLELAKMRPSPLERVERLEQLRALQAGFKIRVGQGSYRSYGVDTVQELERVEGLLPAS